MSYPPTLTELPRARARVGNQPQPATGAVDGEKACFHRRHTRHVLSTGHTATSAGNVPQRLDISKALKFVAALSYIARQRRLIFVLQPQNGTLSNVGVEKVY